MTRPHEDLFDTGLTGAFRRAILLESKPGLVEAELEDDMHHFRVRLYHDGRQILKTEGLALRIPWITCADAPVALESLVGTELFSDAGAVFKRTDPAFQCTHALHLAGLAIAHATRAAPRRLYQVELSDPRHGTRRLRLGRDHTRLFDWRLDRGTIVSPTEVAGLTVENLRDYAKTQDPDTAEAIQIVRRCLTVSTARAIRTDGSPYIEDVKPNIRCFSTRPANISRAFRVYGNLLDLKTEGRWPLQDKLIDEKKDGED